MSRRTFGKVVAPLALGLAVGSGCGSDSPSTTEQKIHATQKFSADELNAPLSPQARARGAQVAPAPTR